jgi:hypothetical protein
VSDLLAPVTDDQRLLLGLIGQVYGVHGKPPIWQYLEAELDRRGLEPEALLRSLPMVGGSSPISRRYGLVAFNTLVLGADAPVRLTVAGYRHVPDMRPTARFFVDILRLLIERRRNANFTPTAVTSVVLTSDDLKAACPAASDQLLKLVPDMLDLEPATMRGSSHTAPDGKWTRQLDRDLLNYADVQDVDGYVARVVELYTPAPAPVARTFPQPFDLVASLEYFNTTWQLHFGKPVVQWFNGERIARLTLPVASFDEFASQLSTVSELLKNLRVPGGAPADKTAIARLRTNLEHAVSSELARSRIADAATTLVNVVHVRNSLIQHSGREHAGVRALTDLGVAYPVADWGDAWITVQTRTLEALGVLREEIQILHQEATST